jgi:single-stranded DNA-binding protein
MVVSERPTGDSSLTAFVPVNIFGESLVRVCQERLRKGIYVIVEGELMNRPGQHGELMEVRARDVVFV